MQITEYRICKPNINNNSCTFFGKRPQKKLENIYTVLLILKHHFCWGFSQRNQLNEDKEKLCLIVPERKFLLWLIGQRRNLLCRLIVTSIIIIYNKLVKFGTNHKLWCTKRNCVVLTIIIKWVKLQSFPCQVLKDTTPK